ncbi:MAG: YqgE/AlgH family protein [Proteobacteria bacterium]|nr:YqgE/AlgH family protein [Pseudomonadota bacterium]
MSTKHTTDGTRLSPALLAGDSPFRNQLLVAMPGLQADVLNKSVIYVCAHSPAGAMGIVLNQKLPAVVFKDLLTQLDFSISGLQIEPVVHFGGPVETGRGFVLHSTDYIRENTVRINDRIGITGTVDILRSIADGAGPHRSIFALGYAGWGPGQLDEEIQRNNWLTIPADEELIFDLDLSGKWEKAMKKIGITPTALSSDVGHA